MQTTNVQSYVRSILEVFWTRRYSLRNRYFDPLQDVDPGNPDITPTNRPPPGPVPVHSFPFDASIESLASGVELQLYSWHGN